MLVLLVHGLGRTPVSLFGLAAVLRRAGHHTTFFAYSPTLETLPRIRRRLARRLRAMARQGKAVGLVGHSLGGLLLRLALAEVPELRVRRLVMLGTPNRPPRLARLAARWFLFRRLTGDCGRFLSSPDAVAHVPAPAVPYTLVAGAAGPRGRYSPFGADPNDGVVALAEIPINQSDAPLVFPVWHSFMTDDDAVRGAVVATMMTVSESPARQ